MKKIITLLLCVCIACNFLIFNTYAESESTSLRMDGIKAILSELSVMQGDPDGNMRYTDPVSRGEFAKIAVMASKYKDYVVPEMKLTVFSDVKGDNWCSPYVWVGVKNSMISGYPDGNFRPNDMVLYEEAANVFLKILGYTAEDIGPSWPYGPVALANNIGLGDNADVYAGKAITRFDVANMVYNMLNTPEKGSNQDYISNLGYSIIEDTTFISSYEQDRSVGIDNVYTTAGTYKKGDNFNTDAMGMSGELVVKDGKKAISFIASDEDKIKYDKYVVYSAADGNVVLYKDYKMTSVDILDSIAVYKDEMKLSYADVKNQLEMGDCLFVTSDISGDIKHIRYTKGNVKGPVLASKGLGVDWNKTSVIRNGVKASKSDITSNDIIYYCEDLNLVLAYYRTVTGVYEKATPNRDTPTSVTISGKTYQIEGADALNKLSSNGNLAIGDTITVVFGKDDKIADVITNNAKSADVYGYLIETGTGVYETDDGSEYSSLYVKVVLPNGEIGEYSATKDYSDYKNKIVRVSINNGKAIVAPYTGAESVYGKVDWSNKKIGSFQLADNVSILDVRTTDKNKNSGYAVVFPQRLDKVNLEAGDVYYVKRDENQKITELILADVTGDSWSYGILSDAMTLNKKVIGYEIYSKNSVMQTTTTGIGGMAVGKGVKMSLSNRGAENIQMLSEVKGISKITDTQVIGNTTYTISDKAEVYVRSGSMGEGYTYNYSDLSRAVGIERSKIIAAYFDKADNKGGRVRVIVISE